jgi:hypothetical protein
MERKNMVGLLGEMNDSRPEKAVGDRPLQTISQSVSEGRARYTLGGQPLKLGAADVPSNKELHDAGGIDRNFRQL